MSKIIAYSWHSKRPVVAHIIDLTTGDKAICGTHSENWSPWPTDRMKLKTPNADQQCVKCRRLMDFAQIATEWQAKMHADHTTYMLQRDLEWAEAERQGRAALAALTALFQAKFATDPQARLHDSPEFGLQIIYALSGIEMTLSMVKWREIGGDA